MGSTIDPMVQMQTRGAARRPLPRPSVSMSLRLVIPWRVALQQSSPPLHQPQTILNASAVLLQSQSSQAHPEVLSLEDSASKHAAYINEFGLLGLALPSRSWCKVFRSRSNRAS